MHFNNRPYQDQAHDAIRSAYLKGFPRQLLAMATGTGKTIVFSQLPDKMKDVLPGQTLVLAHREELIDQNIDKMRLANPGLRIDKEKAEHHADTSQADVVVASVATLGRKGTKRLDQYNWQNFDKYVTDEAHHSTAQSYMNIYEAAGLLQPGDKRLLLGVTATPQRSDGKALAQIYQKISYVYSMRQAIEEGWLVDVRGVRVRSQTSLDSIKTVAGDFAQDMLADAVNNPTRNQLVVKAWLEHGDKRQTVGFTVDIQHAVDLAEMFRHYGVNAEAIWGDDPERASKLKRHRQGEITVLLNCGVLTEGYDDWHIACILLARPTKSGTLYVQMVGRGTRLQDGTGNLLVAPSHITAGDVRECINGVCSCPDIKRDCIVIDVVDASSKHSLVTLPTLMGMSASLDLKGQSVVKAIQNIEEAQRQHNAIDFTALSDITNLDTYVERVDLFTVKFPPEVESNSDLMWHAAATGGFILQLPNRDQVTIRQNMLDKWELSAHIRGRKFKGERETVEQAFQAADNLVEQEASDTLNILRREAKWHAQPATMAQIVLLRKLLRGRTLPNDIDKGTASKLIGSLLAGKS